MSTSFFILFILKKKNVLILGFNLLKFLPFLSSIVTKDRAQISLLHMDQMGFVQYLSWKEVQQKVVLQRAFQHCSTTELSRSSQQELQQPFLAVWIRIFLNSPFRNSLLVRNITVIFSSSIIISYISPQSCHCHLVPHLFHPANNTACYLSLSLSSWLLGVIYGDAFKSLLGMLLKGTIFLFCFAVACFFFLQTTAPIFCSRDLNELYCLTENLKLFEIGFN